MILNFYCFVVNVVRIDDCCIQATRGRMKKLQLLQDEYFWQGATLSHRVNLGICSVLILSLQGMERGWKSVSWDGV